jgi:hypothetical protein
MAAHPQPERLAQVGRAAGNLGRVAAGTAEELLDALTMVGDHGTQRAVDEAVDAVAGGLRSVAAEGMELALVLGANATARSTSPSPAGPAAEARR